jgi:hypothetical protein
MAQVLSRIHQHQLAFTVTRFFASTLPAAVVGAMVLGLAPNQADAATTVCTPVFMPPNVAPGSPISADLGTTSPCPPPTVTVSLNTVGNGLAMDQVGTVFSTDLITGLGTSDFMRTSPTAVGIGALAETMSSPTTQSFTLTYSKPVVNPYLFFAWIDGFSEYKFNNPVSLLQAYKVTLSGNTVTSSGDNNQDSGFVVQLTGMSSIFTFDIVNQSSDNTMAVFTTGPAGLVPPVPGPLPVVGLGIAYSMSRKLRRRILN